jgi:hypothetical protein
MAPAQSAFELRRPLDVARLHRLPTRAHIVQAALKFRPKLLRAEDGAPTPVAYHAVAESDDQGPVGALLEECTLARLLGPIGSDGVISLIPKGNGDLSFESD